MARRVPWRRTCPDVVANRIEDASAARIYLLRETGPTGFLLKEDGVDRKFKVCLAPSSVKQCNKCFVCLTISLRRDKPHLNHLLFWL